MIVWCDGPHDPAENMRRDGLLLESLVWATGIPGVPAEPVLRLFRFQPHGITLGHAQDPARALDLERCREDGVPWAVRPTGGRAIFHAEEWTYSLAAPIADAGWGGSLAEAYARASWLIRASLARLGVPAVLAARAARGPDPAPGERHASSACFAATARHEILLGGRKLAGSAQRRTARALLQQGSILLGPGHLRLADYLAIPAERRREVRDRLRMASADAGSWLGGDAPLERWAEALRAELSSAARVVHGAGGGFLLTLREAGPYTPAASKQRDQGLQGNP